jgi:hypothetical protein
LANRGSRVKSVRAHPHRCELHFEDRAQNNLPVFFDPAEKFEYRTAKVIHNCPLADRCAPQARPIAASLKHGWLREMVEKVERRWSEYGDRY